MAKMKTKYCSACGRIMIGNYYKRDGSSKKYCRNCAKRINKEIFDQKVQYKLEKREEKRRERIERTGMTQSYLAMFLKIILGVYLLCSGYVLGLVVGIILLCWGIIPFLKRNKNRRS